MTVLKTENVLHITLIVYLWRGLWVCKEKTGLSKISFCISEGDEVKQCRTGTKTCMCHNHFVFLNICSAVYAFCHAYRDEVQTTLLCILILRVTLYVFFFFFLFFVFCVKANLITKSDPQI